MTRMDKHKSYREQCSETKLIDILDMQDKKINLLLNRVECLIDKVEEYQSRIYELVKEDEQIFRTDIYAEDFDEMFGNPLKELDEIFNIDSLKVKNTEEIHENR